MASSFNVNPFFYFMSVFYIRLMLTDCLGGTKVVLYRFKTTPKCHSFFLNVNIYFEPLSYCHVRIRR